MKSITVKETESILFNLDSMRIKLLNEQYEHPEKEDEYQVKIDEVEELLHAIDWKGRMTNEQLNRAREIVAERQLKRYVTCLNAGLFEEVAGGAFYD